MSKKTRKIEQTIEIAAPPEAVWKALTDAEELMRWFPLDARTQPGPGGKIWFSWGPPYEGESRIEIWEPSRRLVLKDDWDHSEDGNRQERASEQVAMDFTLESEKGKTILRLVHSGFSADADWDDEFEGTRRGWLHEFLGLKHFLENHAGQDRKSVWARVKVAMSSQEAWPLLVGATGLNLDGLVADDSFDRTTATGEKLQGRVLLCRPPEDFCAVLENANRAFLRISLEQRSKPRAHVEPNVWLSTYNLMNHQVMSFQTSWTKLLINLFPNEFKE